jgi:superfamily I DNA and/or RNA helicase
VWRARRAVIVGDPLQLKPVVTLPFRGQQGIRSEYAVSEKWLPKSATVQELADRHNRWGTNLLRGARSIWVGAPLQVHRRCSDPMFTISNKIAYNEMMIHGADPKPKGDLPPSRWINVTGSARGHYKPVELAEAKQLIDDLLAGSTDRPLTPSDIIVISPFRDVASELSQLKTHFGRTLRAGTVHTAQGKQARVVILVLGGNPQRPGAKRWAASEPNLVNVAASRAKERLYVIGDKAAWSSYNYFDVMAEGLAGQTDSSVATSHRSRS